VTGFALVGRSDSVAGMTARLDHREYSTAVEGGGPVQLRFTIEGRLEPGSYLTFVADRAGWLDLDGWVRQREDGIVELVAAGPEALVGALEMACTLGPLDALIARIDAVDEPGDVAAGFEVRL
jgi:acylphosphatase